MVDNARYMCARMGCQSEATRTITAVDPDSDLEILIVPTCEAHRELIEAWMHLGGFSTRTFLVTHAV